MLREKEIIKKGINEFEFQVEKKRKSRASDFE